MLLDIETVHRTAISSLYCTDWMTSQYLTDALSVVHHTVQYSVLAILSSLSFCSTCNTWFYEIGSQILPQGRWLGHRFCLRGGDCVTDSTSREENGSQTLCQGRRLGHRLYIRGGDVMDTTSREETVELMEKLLCLIVIHMATYNTLSKIQVQVLVNIK